MSDRFIEILRAIHGDMPDAFADSARLAFVHALKEAQPCIGGDPSCPCQDGDACHYRDTPTTKAWPAEGEKLKHFALAMLEHWPLGDVDGGDLQEMAVKHGLLVPETRTEVCSEEGCNCAEYYSAEEWAEGVTCYRRAAWLKAGMSEDTRSRRLADAGFTARDKRLARDECDGLFTAQMLPIHKCRPLDKRLRDFANSLMSRAARDPTQLKMIEETEKRIRQALIYGTSHPEAYDNPGESPQPRKTMIEDDETLAKNKAASARAEPRPDFDQSELVKAIKQDQKDQAHARAVAAAVSMDEMRALVDIDLINASERLNEVVRAVFMYVSRRDDETMNRIAPDGTPEEGIQAIEDQITLDWNRLEEATPERWVIIATQHLQQGLMALRRAVEAPTEF